MSKSLGNFFTIREVLKKYDAEIVRFFILRAHYRSPLNYSDQHLDDAKGALTRLYTALKSSPVRPEPFDKAQDRSVEGGRAHSPAHASTGSARADGIDWNEPYAQRFKAAMDDDLNTPEAVAVLFDLANEVNRDQSAQAAAQLKTLAGVLGLLQRDAQQFLQGDSSDGGLDDAAINAQIEARIAAKKAKNFAEADRIRKELLEAGIVLEDNAQGTSWRRA
jgi:cysteinyl-tRNA synthetase